MPATRPPRRAFAAITAALLLTSALAACNGQAAPGASPSESGSAVAADAVPAALPLATAVPAPIAMAPPVTELPEGRGTRVAHLANRRDGYGYLDRAYYQQNAVESAPPDYSFDGGGVRPWTWATGDGARVISEPVAGGYRYYYYNAGSERPYLVRDPQNSYAYDNGALVGVYAPSGEWIDARPDSPSVRYASRYYDRGNTLWRAANHAPHQSVNAYQWGDRRADLAAQRNAWQQRMQSDPEWSSWNTEHRDSEQGYWADARDQHQQAAQQFGTWQQNRYQGAPPQFYGNPDQGGNGNPGQRHDHTAAIVGGVVGIGIVAAVANAVFGHHDAPRPAPAQTVVSPGPAAGYQHSPDQVAPRPGPTPTTPGAPVQAPVQPAYAPAPHAPQPSAQPVYAPVVRPSAMPARPAYAPAPRAPQPPAQPPYAPVARPSQIPARPANAPAMHAPPPAYAPAAPRAEGLRPRPVANPAWSVRPTPATRIAPVPAPPAMVRPAPVHIAPMPVMPVRAAPVQPVPVRPALVQPPIVHAPAAIVRPGPVQSHQPPERDRPHDPHDQHHGPGD